MNDVCGRIGNGMYCLVPDLEVKIDVPVVPLRYEGRVEASLFGR